jgi:hypothetical protein
MKPIKKSRHSASVPFSVVAKQDADALKACFALSMFSISSFSQELRSPENPVRFS